MNILILGATGMAGSAFYNYFKSLKFNVYGTYRNRISNSFFKDNYSNLIYYNNIFDNNLFQMLINQIKPDYVINCIGVTNKKFEDISLLYKINADFPIFLDTQSKLLNFKLIHLSTDCVFSGTRGFYSENDLTDPSDDYGKSKLEGEKLLSNNSFIIRTSIIGHEFNTNRGLLEWFLNQKDFCYGYKNAIFSGFPTIYLAEIIHKYIFSSNMYGLYHIASNPISKLNLLKLIAKVYNKRIKIIPEESVKIDRSLNSSFFISQTGFSSPDWDFLINQMFLNSKK